MVIHKIQLGDKVIFKPYLPSSGVPVWSNRRAHIPKKYDGKVGTVAFPVPTGYTYGRGVAGRPTRSVGVRFTDGKAFEIIVPFLEFKSRKARSRE